MPKVSISIISLLGMKILLPRQILGKRILEELDKFHPSIGLKLAPLRCASNNHLSLLGHRVTSFEGPWFDEDGFIELSLQDRLINRRLFGADAYQRMQSWSHIFPDAKKIDLGENFLIETADLPDRRSHLDDLLRGQEIDRGICLDLFHARELIVGRNRIMRGVLSEPDQSTPQELCAHLENISIFASKSEVVEFQMRGTFPNKSIDAREFLNRKGIAYEELLCARKYAGADIPLSLEFPPWWSFEDKRDISRSAYDIWDK